MMMYYIEQTELFKHLQHIVSDYMQKVGPVMAKM